MKHLLRILYFILLIWIALIPGALNSARAQEEVYIEAFDNPDLPGWEFSPTAAVTGGYLHLGPDGTAQPPISFADAEIKLRIRRVSENGLLAIHYHQSEAGSYQLRLQDSHVAVVRLKGEEEIVLAEGEMEFPSNTWVTLQIVIQAGEQVISIGEINFNLTALDPSPLESGGMLFRTDLAMDAQIDDLEVHLLTPFAPEETALQETPSSPPAAENDEGMPDFEALTWQRLGGPPGGLGYDIRMRPDNPDVMFVTDAHAGIHKSVDGGKTWQPINEGIAPFSGGIFTVFCVTIDPHDYDTIWIGTQFTGKVYRSTDNGETWEARDKGIAQEGRSVRGITVDPADPDTIYAGVEVISTAWAGESLLKRFDLVKGEVYKSENAGLSWQRIWVGDNLARYIWIDPRNSNLLYVSTGIFDRDAANSDIPNGIWGGVGILRSKDGGQTWTVLNENNGLGGLYIPSLFMHPDNPDMLLAAVTGTTDSPGAYLTRDGGDTWQLVLARPPGTGIEAVEIAESNPDIWYVAAESRIWRSDDAGRTWQDFAIGIKNRPAGLPIDLQVDPRDPYRIFVNNYGGGNFLSEDGGETWVEASQGYTGLGVYAVVADPQNPSLVMAKNFVSSDGGITWIPYPIPEFEIYAIWPDTMEQNSKVIAGAEAIWIGQIASPDWTTVELVDLQTELAAGRIEDERMNIAALGVSPTNNQVIFAGFAHGNCAQGIWERCLNVPTPGLFRSVDGGNNWVRLEKAPWHPFATLSIDFNPVQDGVVYAGTAVGLYRSKDGGKTWNQLRDLDRATNHVPVIDWGLIPKGLESPIVRDVRVDPFNPDTVYAAATPGGVYRSSDGGDTWVQTAAGMDPNEPVYFILPDPTRPGVLYASSEISGVFVSTNNADSWTLMSKGLLIYNMRGLSISGDGRHLYAGSLGGGVFRMDFYGDPPEIKQVQIDQPTVQPEDGGRAAESESGPTPTPESEKSSGKMPCLGGALPLAFVGFGVIYRSRRKY